VASLEWPRGLSVTDEGNGGVSDTQIGSKTTTLWGSSLEVAPPSSALPTAYLSLSLPLATDKLPLASSYLSGWSSVRCWLFPAQR
jgi:hypothetical protein